MTTITIDLPNDLAYQLQPLREQLPQFLERGLRQSSVPDLLQFTSALDLFEFLASLPSPTEVIALRPSPELQERIHDLLEKNRLHGLSASEEAEWKQIEYVEHLVRMAKTRAHLRLQQ